MPDSDILSFDHFHRSIGLLLIDGFALMSYASIVEPFRAANTLSGLPLYSWHHLSVGGEPVPASNGVSILVEGKVGDIAAYDTLFVFAAGNPASFGHRKTFAWLRELAADGVQLAGVSGGPYLLARAGVLQGYRATVHWEHSAAMSEEFPSLSLEPGLYVIDRRRLTCAGGVAGLDLAIELIRRDHGADLADRVGEWFIRAEQRDAEGPQRPGVRERYRVRDARMVRALTAMEANVETAIDRPLLAKIAGVSLRQLERLFKDQLGESVASIHRRIRLNHAAWLLRSTSLPVTAIAVASGFASAAHFSRCYSARFGNSPSSHRAT